MKRIFNIESIYDTYVFIGVNTGVYLSWKEKHRMT